MVDVAHTDPRGLAIIPRMTDDELLRTIAQAKREGWKELDLSGEELTMLPAEIGQLEQLQNLHISENELTALPTEIGQLKQLRVLYAYDNHLTTLPAEISELAQLAELWIGGNQLTTLPSELFQLSQLRELRIGGNQLNKLPATISQLNQLEILDASGNQLSMLPIELGQLMKLIELEVDDNQLIKLPAELGLLERLQILGVSNNQLSVLPSELGQLTQLWDLNIEGNQLKVLPTSLSRLKQLEVLDANYNQLTMLPKWMWKLPKLVGIGLYANLLPVPPEVLNDSKIDLQNTLFRRGQGGKPAAQLILREYANIMRSGTPLNEARVIVVGEARAGKTSLVRRLLGEPFDPNENSTHGIFIHKLGVPSDLGEIAVNVWDFGGQDIYKATHQFFFSERAVYVLALNANQNEAQNRVEYWLNLINSYGKGARVIVAINKSAERTLNLDERRYKLNHDHIAGNFLRTDAKTGLGIDALRQAIETEVRGLRHVHTRLYDRHIAVKNKLAHTNKRYISREQFADYCDEAGVTGDEPQAWLLRLLNDLGSAISFDDPNVAGKFVLNPEWVTRGVYAVLEHTPGARVCLSDIRSVLDTHDYPGDAPLWILNLMRKFELCYPMDETADPRYLLLDRLPDNTPAEVEGWERDADALRLEYEYAALPGSVITRVVARLHIFVQGEPWRSGAFLRSADGRNEALIRSDAVTQRTFIAVRGHEATRRDFFAAIRAQFEHVHATVNLTPTAFVPLPAHLLKPEHRGIKIAPISYKKLLRYEQNGRASVYVDEINEDILVRELLDGVRVEVMPQMLRKVLSTLFTPDDLMVLCGDLGFDHANIFSQHDPINLVAQKLVAHLDHRHQRDELLRYIRRERPGAI